MRRWGFVVTVLAMMGVGGCQSEPSYDTAPHDAIKSTVTPSASHGVAATTREFATFNELLRALGATGDCSGPKLVTVETVSFYLAEGMAPLIATVAICDNGRGPVIGELNPGTMPEFQRAYQRAVTTDPILWYSETHVLMVGNGFFVFPLTTVTPGWEFSGLRHLRCDAEQADVSYYEEPIPADIPGCSLHEEPWRSW